MGIEQSTSDNDIRILLREDATAHVGWLDRLRMARQVAEGLHDTPPVTCPRLRAAVRWSIGNLLPGTVTHRIYPYPTDWEAVAGVMRDIRTMAQDRTLLAAVNEREKVVGIGGYTEVGRNGDSPVVELRRTVVDKDERKRGVYRRLADTRLKEIHFRVPDATVVNATRQPAVIRWGLEHGFREIDWQTFYLDLKGMDWTGRHYDDFDDRVRRFGWRYFLRDPERDMTPQGAD
jgi:predicted GNAT family N-acyltransferase